MKKNSSLPALIVFLNVCFISSGAMAIYMRTMGISISSSAGSTYIALISSLPGLAAIGVSALFKRSFNSLGYKLNLKGNIWLYVMSWLAPALLAAGGAALYFLIYPSNCDPSMAMMTEELVKSGVRTENVKTLFKLQLIGGLFIAPVANLVSCGMEELGFRGFLLPLVKEKTSVQSAVLISSLLWGLWYVPAAVIGYRYGAVTAPQQWKAAGFVILFCLMTGCITSYLRLKTDSILPGVLFRCIINGFATAGAWFSSKPYDSFTGPVVWGIIGGLPLLLFGALCISFCSGKKFSMHLPESGGKDKEKTGEGLV